MCEAGSWSGSWRNPLNLKCHIERRVSRESHIEPETGFGRSKAGIAVRWAFVVGWGPVEWCGIRPDVSRVCLAEGVCPRSVHRAPPQCPSAALSPNQAEFLQGRQVILERSQRHLHLRRNARRANRLARAADLVQQ